MSLFDKLRRAKEEKMQQTLEEGRRFMAENALREGVETLASGLQIEILKQGAGPMPGLQDTVTCHYHGTLIDGRVFDSSEQRGRPASFPVGRVIAGWTEALQRMPVGSRRRLVIPPNLAYGEQQAGPLIGPNSTLIFEVELLGF
jgi:FKBP-type peptidyl-prolyl cis-trans isomerase FklB